MSLALRPYQARALDETRAHIRAGRRRVVLCIPTGGGKTSLAAEVARGARWQGSRLLFLAHRKELIRQPFCRFVRWGVDPADIGVVMPGVKKGPQDAPPAGASDLELFAALARANPDAPIQIGTMQSVPRRAPIPADIVVVDEAHRALGATYRRLVAERYPDAVLLGLTATPERTDGRGLGEAFDVIVEGPSYMDLVAEGFLVEPKVWSTPHEPDVSAVKTRGGDFAADDVARVVDRPELVGDLVDHYRRRGGGAPALVFASSVEHSQHIAEAFRAAGYRTAHVDGSTPAAERDQAFEGLGDGRLDVVTNCDVATEGVDVPAVKCVILARPTQSLRVYLQQVGRGSRPFGDHDFVILDHAGNARRHGLPQEPREWSLEGRERRGKGALRLPPAWTCEECFAVVPIKLATCPECHAGKPQAVVREIRRIEGELVELYPETPAQKVAAVVAEWARKNEGREIPLKPGWCAYRYRKRFRQRWPRGTKLPTLTPQQWDAIHARDRLKAVAKASGFSPAWAHIAAKEIARGGGR